MRKWPVRVLVPVLGAALLLLGVLALGRGARRYLAAQPRYGIAFADIDCEPPAGLARAEFLQDVRSLGGLPEELSLLDDDLAGRLARAFARHPWVAEVRRVEVSPDRRVRVRLRPRTPVLAVPFGLTVHAVDAEGVLLPATAETSDLPAFRGPVRPPRGRAGTAWGDANVTAAAKTLAFLRDRQGTLRLTTIAKTADGLVLSTPFGSRVLWGHAPGSEAPGEPAAARKLERMLTHCQWHGDLDHPDGPCEHDVRAAGE